MCQHVVSSLLIIGFICDLFVARNDSWISEKTSTWTELKLLKLRASVGIP